MAKMILSMSTALLLTSLRHHMRAKSCFLRFALYNKYFHIFVSVESCCFSEVILVVIVLKCRKCVDGEIKHKIIELHKSSVAMSEEGLSFEDRVACLRTVICTICDILLAPPS